MDHHPFIRSHYPYHYTYPYKNMPMTESSQAIPAHRFTEGVSRMPPETASQKPKVISIPVKFIGSDEPKPPRGDEFRPESAIKIQKAWRGFRVRRSVNKIIGIQQQVNEVENKFIKESTAENERIRVDDKERLKVSESLMALLLKLDSVRCLDVPVRDLRKAVIRRTILLQEKVDSMGAAGNQIDQINNDRQFESEEGERQLGNGNAEHDKLESEVRSRERETPGDVEADRCVKNQEVRLLDDENVIKLSENTEINQEKVDRKESSSSEGRLSGILTDRSEEQVPKQELINVEKETSQKKMGRLLDDIDGNVIESNDESKTTQEKVDRTESSPSAGGISGILTVKSEEQAPKLELIKEEVQNEEDHTLPNDMEKRPRRDEEINEEDHTLPNDMEKRPRRDEEIWSCKDGKNNRELLEKMAADNEKMMGLMAELFEKNKAQTQMLSSLSQRVEHLENAFMSDRFRRNTKKNKRRN